MGNRRDFRGGLFVFIVIAMFFLVVFIYVLLGIIRFSRNYFVVNGFGNYGLCLASFEDRCVEMR